MKEYNRPNKFGNKGGANHKSFGRSGGGNRGGFGRDRGNNFGPREMFTVNCAECGKVCEVPFKPTGDKPVYCNECFASMGGERFNRDSRGPRGNNKSTFKPKIEGRQDETLKSQIDLLNKKIDTLTALVSNLNNAPKSAEPVKVQSKDTKPAVKNASKKATAKKAVKKAPVKVAKKSTSKKAKK